MTLVNQLQHGMMRGVEEMETENMRKSFEAGGGLFRPGMVSQDAFAKKKPTAVEKFKAANISEIGNEGISVTTEPTKRTQGGFATFQKGLTPKNKVAKQGPGSFGLPSGRMPTFEELTGAIGQMAKYVGGLVRSNRARGLQPGVAVTKQKNLGLSPKDEAGILIKELDVFDTPDDRKTEIRKRLREIVSGGTGAGEVAGDIESDVSEIRKLLAQS